MPRDDWYKKDVLLQWERTSLTFAVAQDLFSSHAVDTGSKLLLRSIDPKTFPARGAALDFGCGYGVLGLAWKARKPDWNVRLIDRDALAVEFSAWNAERLGLDSGDGTSWSVGLGPGEPPPAGFDLVLWNVPGKAGEAVLKRLAENVVDTLGRHGVVALVVVNPLAAALHAVYEARQDLDIVHEQRFADHTILHVKRHSSNSQTGNWLEPFERGVFDRDLRGFDTPAGSYTIRPVVGLPEYESLAFDTMMIVSAIEGLPDRPKAVVIAGCGQGHVPVAMHLVHGVVNFTLIDRDLLSLKASARALAAVGPGEGQVRTRAAPDIGVSEPDDAMRVDTAIIRLDDQIPPAVTSTMIQDLERRAWDTGLTIVIGGGSTSVSRWLAAVAKRPRWNARSRLKRHGASAAVLSLAGPQQGRCQFGRA